MVVAAPGILLEEEGIFPLIGLKERRKVEARLEVMEKIQALLLAKSLLFQKEEHKV
jgi:hypothetical protein